jgi:hypothetical protein
VAPVLEEEEVSEITVKCPICGEPYNFYPMMSGNQSACGTCRMKAAQKDGSNRPYFQCTCGTSGGTAFCPEHGTWNR